MGAGLALTVHCFAGMTGMSWKFPSAVKRRSTGSGGLFHLVEDSH